MGLCQDRYVRIVILGRVPTLLENSWKSDPPGKLLEKLLEIRPSWKNSWKFDPPGKTPGILGYTHLPNQGKQDNSTIIIVYYY